MSVEAHSQGWGGLVHKMNLATMFSRLDVQTLLVLFYLSIGAISGSVLLCYIPDHPRRAGLPPPNGWRARSSVRALYVFACAVFWPLAVPSVVTYYELTERSARRARRALRNTVYLPRYEPDPARDPAFRPPRPRPSGGSVVFSARIRRVTWENVPLNGVAPRRTTTPPPCYRETDPRRENA